MISMLTKSIGYINTTLFFYCISQLLLLDM